MLRSRRAAILFQLAIVLMPWTIRRRLLAKVLGFKLAEGCLIGRSIVEAREVRLGEGAYIGHLNFIKGLSRLELGESARLGNLNWVTGFPLENRSYFAHVADRDPSLDIEAHAAVTSRHYIDCTHRITIGTFTTLAGWGSQVLTHAINLRENRQDCAPIRIGRCCFIGTRVVLTPGTVLGDCNVLGAGSVVTKAFTEPYKLVSGVPAAVVKDFPASAAYFTRKRGIVD